MVPQFLIAVFGSSLVRSSWVYLVTNGINSGIPFLLLPVLTRYLSPEEFGTVIMFQVAVGILTAVVGMNTQSAIGRQYFERDEIDFPRYIGNCLHILIATSLITAILIFPFVGILETFMGIPSQWVWTVFVIAIGQYLGSVALVLWQVQVKPIRYGIFGILQTAVNMGITLWLIVGWGYGWEGRILGEVISAGGFGVLALTILIRGGWVRWPPHKKYIGHATRFGGFLIPHVLGAWAIGMTSRVVITNLLGLEKTGLYSAGAQIGQVIGLLQNSFNLAWVPWFFAKLKSGNPLDKVRIVKITYVYVVAIMVTAAMVSGVAPRLIDIIVGPKFVQAGEFVGWIAFGFAFNGMYKMVANYLFYIYRTGVLAWITLTIAVVNIGLNYALVSRYGAIGAAYATAAAFLLQFFLTWLIVSRLYQMPWRLNAKKIAPKAAVITSI